MFSLQSFSLRVIQFSMHEDSRPPSPSKSALTRVVLSKTIQRIASRAYVAFQELL
jgi:hypothetical protein